MADDTTTVLFDSASDETPARRAKYYTPDNAFTVQFPPVPSHIFVAERDRAVAPDAPTGFIALDLGPRMELPYEATTPNLLARYLVLRPGDGFTARLRAMAEVYYVLRGSGETVAGADRVAWSRGDVLCVPGGRSTTHRAGADGALLFLATDEPLMNFLGAHPPEEGAGRMSLVHYPAEEIEARMSGVLARVPGEDAAARPVIFTNEAYEHIRTISPVIGANTNILEPGGDQRPHRHNAAALTLSIQGEGVHSIVDGKRTDWQDSAVMVTPPGALHSHHNRGDRLMFSLVIQDSGIYYYARTVGFSFDR